jgi:hypothetical protein
MAELVWLFREVIIVVQREQTEDQVAKPNPSAASVRNKN